MSKKQSTGADFAANLEKYFGKSFFCEPEIIDISETTLRKKQLEISGDEKEYYGDEKYRYLTAINGRIIRNISEEKPKIFKNSVFFISPIQTLADFFEGQINLTFQKFDNFSGTVTIGIKTQAKTIAKGDILNPALILKNSLTGLFPSGICFAFDRVWCSNGARRREIVSFQDLTENLLTAQAETFGKLIEAHTNIEYSRLQAMQQTQLKNSVLERDITDSIIDLGYPKKFTDDVHYTIHKECEELSQPLNAYLAYNGFNKILFERQDTTMSLDKKEKLDDKIFEFLSKPTE